MSPAVVVVDMLSDTCAEGRDLAITAPARAILPLLRELLDAARARSLPVIFACDSFLEADFIFRGRLSPHSLRGSAGAEVVGDLDVLPGDIILPKRRFSAFFKTDLDQTLRTLGCDTLAVCGITTNVCVQATVLDGLSHDFEVVWLKDCCAAHSVDAHDGTLALYRRSPLEPLLRIQETEAFLAAYDAFVTSLG